MKERGGEGRVEAREEEKRDARIQTASEMMNERREGQRGSSTTREGEVVVV